MQISINPGWPEYVYAGTDRLFLARLGPEISTAARSYAPKRTGDLARSIEFHLRAHSLIVAAHAPYAAYVETGTRPHVIAARNAQALHWSGSGGEFFARRVNHPGTRPEPYLRPALWTVRTA